MGMFDWYRPAGIFNCPICGTPLREWQGKMGPCLLFVWQQGVAFPVEHAAEEECRVSMAVREEERLPPSFDIYCYDCETHRVDARCEAVAGIWSDTRIHAVVDLKRMRPAL